MLHSITRIAAIVAVVVCSFSVVPRGFAEGDDTAAADEAAKGAANANNPLANMVAFNFQFLPK